MNYRHRNSASKQTSWKPLAAAVVLLLLVITVNTFKPQSLPRALYTITSPLWRTEKAIGDWSYSMLSYLESKNQLQNENTALKAETQNLRNKLLILDSLQIENDSMKNLLARNLSNKGILGIVLSAPPFSPYDVLILDVGSDTGVKLGDLVISGDSVAIGDITDVFASYSKVTLFSSASREVPVLIGQNKIEALARGVGGGSFEVILPREVKVKEGDSVTLPNISPLVYGTVHSVQTSDVDFLQLVTFTSPVNIYELRYVAVVPGNISLTNNAVKNN